MTRAEMEAIFLLAGYQITQVWTLPNGYWPDAADYAEIRRNSPWWLAQTQFGPIRIGWRKRVIDIDWSGTGHKVDAGAVTPDDVTRSGTNVHAYGHGSAVNYLRNLRFALQRNGLTVGGDGGEG